MPLLGEFDSYFASAPAVAAFSPDGRLLAFADGPTVLRYDMLTGESVGPAYQTSRNVREIAFDGDGKRLLCVTAIDETKGQMQTVNFATCQPVGEPLTFLSIFDWYPRRGGSLAARRRSRPMAAVYSPRTNWLACGPGKSKAQSRPRSQLKLTAKYRSPVSRRTESACSSASMVKQSRLAKSPAANKSARRSCSIGRSRSLAIDDSGEVAATATAASIQCWFLETGEPLGRAIEAYSGVTSLCFASGRELLLAGDQSGLVRTFRSFAPLPPAALKNETIQAITGLRWNGSDSLEPLDHETWAARINAWQVVRRSIPADSMPQLPPALAAAVESDSTGGELAKQAELNSPTGRCTLLAGQSTPGSRKGRSSIGSRWSKRERPTPLYSCCGPKYTRRPAGGRRRNWTCTAPSTWRKTPRAYYSTAALEMRTKTGKRPTTLDAGHRDVGARTTHGLANAAPVQRRAWPLA